MRVEIVTKCKHGKSDPHSWEPSTSISDEGWCPGGSRRVLEPGEAERIIARVLAALRPDGLETVGDIAILEAIVDALAEGEQ